MEPRREIMASSLGREFNPEISPVVFSSVPVCHMAVDVTVTLTSTTVFSRWIERLLKIVPYS